MHQFPKFNTDEPIRCNNDLLIYKISSTCFGQYFAHLQERKTEIFYSIWYPVVVVARETVSGSVPNLLQHKTLNVWGSSSAHHQEFIHCTLGTGICHTGL